MIRHIKNIFFLIFILLFSFITSASPTLARSAADNFHFKSFTGDYHITKDPHTGIAKMHVIETLVAVFPNYDQNHGLRRIIPVTNQGGKNIVINHPSDFQAKVSRNGSPEPYTATYEDKLISLKIGSKDRYVQGEQTYTIEYDFENVASFFAENNPQKIQEIYWNTNGNAWTQSFNSVTANVHIDKTLLPHLSDNYACYSGSYGAKNQCQVQAIDDGFSFSATNLKAHEGLTFVLGFKDNTFNFAPQKFNYIAYITFGGLLVVSALTFTYLIYRYFKKIYPKKHYYKNLLTAPQFTPLKNYTIAEAASLYLKSPKNVKVATALELAVQKKIAIIKKKSNHKLLSRQDWVIKILETEGFSKEEATLLRILRGNTKPLVAGQEIELKRHAANTQLNDWVRLYDEQVKKSLIQKSDLESALSASQHTDSTVPKAPFNFKKIFYATPVFFILILPLIGALMTQQDWFINTFGDYSSIAIIKDKWLLDLTLTSLFPLYIFMTYFGIFFDRRYLKYTNQGLDHANYLAGLEDYIKMAETDRLRFLQSVDGVDTTNEGIVKLYEKLLPYAVIFGQEKSWLKVLNQYTQLIDNSESDLIPAWYALSTTNFNSFTSNFSSSTSSSSVPSSSSSSGFSSGGGFSGGGGGGGGGGGW